MGDVKLKKIISLIVKIITIIALFIIIDFFNNIIALNVPFYINYDVEINNLFFILKIVLAVLILIKKIEIS